MAATEDGSLGERGRVTVPLERHLDASGGRPTLYACGPDAMMHAVACIAAGAVAARRGEPRPVDGLRHRHVPRLRRARAGRARKPRPKYRCACTEGPVFDADRVVWPGDEASRARALASGGDAGGARG